MNPIKQQIIAMGGGGFSMEPDNLLLDRYILEQSPSPTPKVCFLPTASGDSDNYIRRFYDAFTQLDCRPRYINLFRPTHEDLDSFIQEQDIIYVGGGSTFNLLALWKAWGLDKSLRQAWENGVVLAGLSAGSICWFEEGLSDSIIPGQYQRLEALGFLPGSHCPHYDGESKRPLIYRQQIGAGNLSSGTAADDGVALHYIGTDLKAVVSSRPTAKAYWVGLENGEVEERAIAPRYLGLEAG
ncbi:MAG: peptidase E [Leptolyngbya foveolarum]|uniref:Peptidase E n=1 Tax=Leptolyngbya foveolarum TaxID=47253 RepID=A0A2W4UDN9_9CYAN|nr:MAG: peptidase E [Leptolyngbya foveolarum]